jgi:hypothetical protein
VLENWQTPDGLVIPPALRPWMMGIEFIPFVRKLDKKVWLITSCLSGSGLADSDSGIQESTRMHPNLTLDRIRPNPESIFVGSKCPYRL